MSNVIWGLNGADRLTPDVYSQTADNGVFSKWSKTFTEFSEFREFRESEKSLRHELDLV